jgi:uncharacterized alkaline shock family protein YloU
MQKKSKTPNQYGRPVSIHEALGTVAEKEPVEDVNAIRISENVVASVTRKYVLQIDGVVRFASGSIVSGLAEMIGRKSQESSIVVDMEGDEVRIAVNLVLRFGVRVPEVAEAVQNIVRTKVEELTGKNVTGVRVTIQDLQEVEEKDDAEAAESEA